MSEANPPHQIQNKTERLLFVTSMSCFLFCSFMVWMALPALGAILTQQPFALAHTKVLAWSALTLLIAGALRIPLSQWSLTLNPFRLACLLGLIQLFGLLLFSAALAAGVTHWTLFLAVGCILSIGGACFSSVCAQVAMSSPNSQKGTNVALVAAVGNLGLGLTYPFFSLTQKLTPGSNSETKIISFLLLLSGALIASIFLLSLSRIARDKRDCHLDQSRLKEVPLSRYRNRPFWFSVRLYTLFFGSYVGLSASLPYIYETNETLKQSGGITGTLIALGAMSRLFGDHASKRFGAAIVNQVLIVFIAIVFSILGMNIDNLDPTITIMLLSSLFAGIGAANGSSLSLITPLFRKTLETKEMRQAEFDKRVSYCVGIAGAVSAMVGAAVPIALWFSDTTSGSIAGAYIAFGILYLGYSIHYRKEISAFFR